MNKKEYIEEVGKCIEMTENLFHEIPKYVSVNKRTWDDFFKGESFIPWKNIDEVGPSIYVNETNQVSFKTDIGRDILWEMPCCKLLGYSRDENEGSLVDIVLAGTEYAPPKKEEGRKLDDGKPRWSLLPFRELKDVVDILTFGAKKYAPGNWKKVSNATERYSDAAMRHLTSWLSGEKKDPESGKSHLAHVACNILFLMWFENEGM